MRKTIGYTLPSLLIVLGLTATAAEPFDAAARARFIAPFIDELTIAVIHVDLTRVEVGPLVDRLAELIPDVKMRSNEIKAEATQTQSAFVEHAGKDLYCVVSLADFPFQGPLFVFPLYDTADLKALDGLLPPQNIRKPSRGLAVVSQRVGNVLFVGPQRMVQRLQQMRPDPRPELTDAFEAAGDTAAQVLLLPTESHRRVIEEMLPGLPKEIGGGSSTVVTRGLRWAAIGVDTSPQLSLNLVIQSQDAQAAQALRDKWIDACRHLSQYEVVKRFVPKFDQVAELLTPTVEANRVVLTLDEQNRRITAVLDLLSPPLEQAYQRVQRAAAMNNLKHIALGMHNYHDAHKGFPTAASYGADGKPLLSWRVHILPYIEHKRLWDQFHLDEPWDSPHNRTLIDKMPAIYRSPASKLREKGRTSYLVPRGEETVFPGPQPVAIKDIADGTSKTIMVVEADDDRAVIWTKPEDLPFDPEHPEKGLGGMFEGGFNSTFCDGSVHFLPMTIDPKTLRALFTRDGGEVIKLP